MKMALQCGYIGASGGSNSVKSSPSLPAEVQIVDQGPTSLWIGKPDSTMQKEPKAPSLREVSTLQGGSSSRPLPGLMS